MSIALKSGTTVEIISVLALTTAYIYYLRRALTKGTPPIKMRTFAAVEAIKEGCDRALEEGKYILIVPGWAAASRGQTAMALSYLNFARYTCDEAAKRGVIVRAPLKGLEEIAIVKNMVKESYTKAGRPDLYNEEMTEYFPTYSIGCMSYFTDPPGVSLTTVIGGLHGGASPTITGAAKQWGSMVIGGSTRWSGMFQVVIMCDYILITDECYAASDFLSGDAKGLSCEASSEVLKYAVLIVGIIGIVAAALGFGETFGSYLTA
jgi:hypothetical protein